MAKAFLYWGLVALAIFVVGPIAGPLLGDLRAADGAGHVTPLTSAQPLTAVAYAALAFALALVVGLLGAWLFGARAGMTLSGLVVAWGASQSGAPDEILRRTQSTSVLWRFSLEGLVFGLFGILMAASLLRVGRRHQPILAAQASEDSHQTHRPAVALLAASGAGLVAGGLLAWLLGFETLKVQTIFAATLAGVGVGAAAHLVGSAMTQPPVNPAQTALIAFVTMAALAIIGPVSALAAPGSGVLRSAYDGSYFPLAALLGLDWIVGGFLGIPIGLAWSGAILEKSQS